MFSRFLAVFWPGTPDAADHLCLTGGQNKSFCSAKLSMLQILKDLVTGSVIGEC